MRGQRLIAAIDLSAWADTTCYLTVQIGPISRYGVKLSQPTESTSHGVVRIFCVYRRMLGVHRYKLELLMMFPPSHPTN